MRHCEHSEAIDIFLGWTGKASLPCELHSQAFDCSTLVVYMNRPGSPSPRTNSTKDKRMLCPSYKAQERIPRVALQFFRYHMESVF